MAVEMNKYQHPKDGSVVVMASNKETVETKHGVFKKLKDQKADNATVRAIVAPSAATVATGSPVNRVPDPAAPVIATPTLVVPNK